MEIRARTPEAATAEKSILVMPMGSVTGTEPNLAEKEEGKPDENEGRKKRRRRKKVKGSGIKSA